MNPNSFGKLFKMTSFGESHGYGIGVVVEGCPAGVVWDDKVLQDFISRRRPGGTLVSSRNEEDAVQILSGIFEGKTLGTPIGMLVVNKDTRSQDYSQIKDNPRSGHADDVWKSKFEHRDHRGGGRTSGRETLSRVMAASLAKLFVTQSFGSVQVHSRALRVGPLVCEGPYSEALSALLTEAKEKGQSYGGMAEIRISSPPQDLGEPVFMKLKSELASAMMGIGAVVGVEFGAGFAAASALGTEFHSEANNYGGIRGGISTGEDIIFRVVVKPTSSILDVAQKGRHDPCILLRALVVFEAMTWLVLADLILFKRLNNVNPTC